MVHKKVIEAALFISSRPLSVKELAKIAGVNSLGYVKDLLEELKKEHKDRGFEIVSSQEGWQMQVKPEFLSKVAHLTPYSDLSEGYKRTLALVVYKEPIKQSELIKIQGSKAYTYIKGLEKRGLIKREKQGRTKILKLTQEFERYFGEEKEKIKQKLEDTIEEAKAQAE